MSMLKVSKIFFWVLVAVLVVWHLPWCYNFFAVKPVDTPFTMYSSVVKDFAQLGRGEDKKIHYTDRSGRTYTEDQFDSILPTFYYRQLVTDDRFPDSICGVAVTPRMVQLNNFNIRFSPSSLNVNTAGLQQLLESMSGRVDLELPDDVFRLTDTGIEFIKMATNTIDTEKSARFTEMMQRKGFRFPAYRLSGNPTDRKEYDEGYVILDAERKLFHVKQTKGRPYVRAIELPEGLNAEHLFITEFPSRRTLCFLSDSEGGFWVVERSDYSVHRTGIPAFHPTQESMLIMGNLFDWTASIKDGESERYYAIDANDYSLIDSIVYTTSSRAIKGLHFTSSKDKFVRPRFE